MSPKMQSCRARFIPILVEASMISSEHIGTKLPVLLSDPQKRKKSASREERRRTDWIHRVVDGLEKLLQLQGLKVARQKYKYEVAGKTIAGENVYAMLRGPRADATETIVLMGAWKNMDEALNQSGVALVLTLARYFNRKLPRKRRATITKVPRMVSMVQGYFLRHHS
jgi:hypothetical protein